MLAFSTLSLTEPPPTFYGEQDMFRTALGLGVVFLVIALIAALGFGVVSAESWVLAKVFFFIFVVLAVFCSQAVSSLVAGMPDKEKPLRSFAIES